MHVSNRVLLCSFECLISFNGAGMEKIFLNLKISIHDLFLFF